MIDRSAGRVLGELLAGFRLVIIEGARQAGKTTLVERQAPLPRAARRTFDDPATLASALEDPVGFLDALPRPAGVDEYQRAGVDFLLAVKRRADGDRTRGQLILTGSSSYSAAKGPVETLAGRAGRLELRTLSLGERWGVQECFVDALFDPGAWPGPPPFELSRPDAVELMVTGGYPEVVTEALAPRIRDRWFDNYVADVVTREALRPLAEVRDEASLRRILRLLAARSAGELVIADVARDADVSRETASRHVSLLEALHLVTVIPAWATSATTRAKRHAKVVVSDVGLAAALTGAAPAAFSQPGEGLGRLFETFVIGELHKQVAWADRSVAVLHFRDRNGVEVDAVLEDRRSGEVAGVEAKSTSSPRPNDARHLATLRDRLGDRFRVGVVVHLGDQVLPLGDRLWAVPLSAMARPA
ncbi:MAG: DUF4143 domain-containing protein [Actinomycetota bacterium]|nr:ATP-binding protein [Acidimicrobiia bacterium]MDQ3293555.1 DUF4143 domain-containing protein [Actinomycetota bacterium]